MNKFKKIIVYFLDVIGVLALVLYGMGAYQKSQKPVEDTKPSTVTVIKERLGEIAELNTASYVSTNVLNKSEYKKFFDLDVWGTKKTLLISCDSIVKAGIKNLTMAEVVQEADTVIVTLPKVEITSVEIDNDSFQKLEETENVFNPITSDFMNDAQKELKELVEERAVEKDLLKMAEKNAEKLVKEMLESASGEYTVEIQWKEA